MILGEQNASARKEGMPSIGEKKKKKLTYAGNVDKFDFVKTSLLLLLLF